MSGLGTSFGFGACTNFPRDLTNSDCILVMGSNMAESHPVAFLWPTLAQQAGATLIHVNHAIHAHRPPPTCMSPSPPGTDLAFLGGIVRYILAHDRHFEEYVVHYTNAGTVLSPDYAFDAEQGVFAGYDAATPEIRPAAACLGIRKWLWTAEGRPWRPKVDPTLQTPTVSFKS